MQMERYQISSEIHSYEIHIPFHTTFYQTYITTDSFSRWLFVWKVSNEKIQKKNHKRNVFVSFKWQSEIQFPNEMQIEICWDAELRSTVRNRSLISNPKPNTLNGERKRKRKGKGCYGRGWFGGTACTPMFRRIRNRKTTWLNGCSKRWWLEVRTQIWESEAVERENCWRGWMRLRKLLYMLEGRKERRTCDTWNLSFGYGFALSISIHVKLKVPHEVPYSLFLKNIIS